MRVIICGGRNVGRTNPNASHLDARKEIERASAERNFVFQKISEINVERPFTEIVAGNEGGAERLGLQWARVNKVAFIEYKRKNSRESTVARNYRMLLENKPNCVICFGAGESTNALLHHATIKGIEIIRFEIPEIA